MQGCGGGDSEFESLERFVLLGMMMTSSDADTQHSQHSHQLHHKLTCSEVKYRVTEGFRRRGVTGPADADWVIITLARALLAVRYCLADFGPN